MSPSGIQEQIEEIRRSVFDLEASPSGVLAYTGAMTIEEYDDVLWRTMRDTLDRIDDLNKGIVDASGGLRILTNGIMFHRH
jgi:hypothetical protein